ncbi:response regulator transcription factor [Paenibacillus contaminans]|uniref:DNA-binding response regulator n=1 Tax=Paenibacillus contaminans TaxID=450362 RepID=A0A329MKX4_9BACL|nr:helix-turn-helix domain-containing protein [Paenibacillus contaminans]RAV20455.1 hypothetical protein DQG23_15955 [Paenibacillus contaminans]
MINAIVVEDEYFVRVGFIAAMPWEQFDIRIVGEAGNGKKAIELLEQMEVDLVITDLAMPVMNGFDLMRHVREHYPNVHLVVLTCHEDFKYIQDAMRCGALDYIVKTEIEGDNMQESLRRILQNIRKISGANRSSAAESVEWDEEDERRLQRHASNWLPLHWVASEAEYADLCGQLEDINPPIPALRQTLLDLLAEWNRKAEVFQLREWTKKAERIQSWDDWESFIADFRLLLRQSMPIAKYPEDVIVRILQAKETMESEMDAKISQSYFAIELKMSRGYFGKAFKDIVGEQFNDYLKALRIARAKELLARTAKPIAAIAEECGFLDHRYFSRQFREETGLLPSEFRSRPL